MNKRYVLMVDTLGQGRVLAERDGAGRPAVYLTAYQAEAEVARNMIVQYQEVVDGDRTLDEVGPPDEVVKVERLDSGDLVDDAGIVLGNVHLPLPY
jgi:hypothetical protein